MAQNPARRLYPRVTVLTRPDKAIDPAFRQVDLWLDTPARVASVAAWNKPLWWPLAVLLGLLAGALLFARRSLRRRERLNARGEVIAA